MDGNHRFRAASLLEYEGLDCVVLDLVDEDLQDILSARMNIVRGHIDRDAFTKLWLRVRQRSDQRRAMATLGITSEAQLDRCVRLAHRRMDADVRAKEQVEILLGRAQIVQDLAKIIRVLIGDGGLGEFQYLVFQLRGSDIVLVRCTGEELEELRVWLSKVKDTGVGMTEAILHGLRAVMIAGS